MSLSTTMIWARKRRLVGVAVAVLLGVAFLSASMFIGETMRSSFDDAFTAANAGTDVVVRSATSFRNGEQRALMDDDVLATVPDAADVRAAFGVIDGSAQILGVDGERIGGGGPPTIGTTWIDDPDLNRWTIVDGRGPRQPDEVVINRAAARQGDLAVGDTTRVLTPDPTEVTIVGIATLVGRDSVGPTTMTAFTLDGARQHLRGGAPGLSSIVVAGDAGIDPAALQAALGNALPDGVQAITGNELTAEQNEALDSDFLGAVRMMLIAFAGISLVVATFTIHNTFSILVAQRTQESALLRAVGASRRQILQSVTVEAAAVGTAASAVGLVAGFGLAAALNAWMNATDFAIGGSVVIDRTAIVVAFVVGIGASLVACVTPALAASRVPPLAALRDVAVDRSSTSFLRAVVGTVLVAAGVATILTSTSADNALLLTAAGALALVTGAVVVGPVVARPAASVLGAITGLVSGTSGHLARRNAVRNPKRVAASASALMIGTAVVTLFTVLGASMTSTFDDMIDEAFQGDLVISDPAFMPAIPAAMTAEIATLPEVGRSANVAYGPMRVDGDEQFVAAADGAALGSIVDVKVSAGSLADVTGDSIGISRKYADDHGWRLGSQVPVSFLDGTTVTATVRAVFDDRAVMGDLFVGHDLWSPHSEGLADTLLFVDYADGVTDRAGKAAVAAVTERYSAPDPQTRSEYVDSVSSQINQLLTIVYGLLAIAVIIAVIGIGNTMSLSMHERRRELGLLRAVGQSRRQVRATVRVEAIIVALFGTAGGLGVGTFAAWGVVRAMHHDLEFGSFALPIAPLAVIVALSVVAGVLAAVRPARRAARSDVLAAIATS